MTFSFNVLAVSGQRINISTLGPDNTIADVKTKIEEDNCMPREMIMLIHSGTRLEDSRTLSSYGISAGTTISLVLAMRAGSESLAVVQPFNFALFFLEILTNFIFYYIKIDDNATSLFDSIRAQPNIRGYNEELKRYVSWRWQRGYLQSIVPITLYCTTAGVLVGAVMSHKFARYKSRFQIITSSACMFGMAGLIISGVHQYLVMRNKYQDTQYYPIVASVMGTSIIVVSAGFTSASAIAACGFGLGICYTGVCAASKWYHSHYLNNFFCTQCLKQVPVSKITPELQPLYVAYLHEHRPLEERQPEERHLAITTTMNDEHRLDARSTMANLYPEVYMWVNFPEWWPFKFGSANNNEEVYRQRQRDELNERRVMSLLESRESAFRHTLRSKRYRD